MRSLGYCHYITIVGVLLSGLTGLAQAGQEKLRLMSLHHSRGGVLLSGGTGLAQAGQEKLRLLSLHHCRRSFPVRWHGPGSGRAGEA
jgi:hypothetical protein